ncbi:MAG: DMT family transporter [Clostridiales Family XIII bacterium]|jgi:drug/metabolite transporter (DMT)-like permease|nr:DMT family transporter [Clostridiales Family XIII bacterium]
MNNTIKSTLILTFTAMIWGFAFVAQRSSMEFVGPFFFSGVRSILGSLTLIIFLTIQKRFSKNRDLNAGALNESAGTGISKDSSASLSAFMNPYRKKLLRGGVYCGLILFAGTNFQQIGLVFTTASKAGFITALYIVLVPILGILLKHKTHWNTWVSVLIAAVGLYFLCLTESFIIQPGDLVILIGAGFWAMHILVIDHFVAHVSAVKLSCIQFLVCGLLSLIISPFADAYLSPGAHISGALQILPAILYTGVLSSGVGFTLQAVGQKYANPTAASIIMSTEAVFGVIGGFLLLHERLTQRELLGCILMFTAVILAQLPVKRREAH